MTKTDVIMLITAIVIVTVFVLVLSSVVFEGQQTTKDLEQIVIHLQRVKADNEMLKGLIGIVRELESLNERQHNTLEAYKDLITDIDNKNLERLVIKQVEATAYTHVATPGVPDINGTGDGITASGKPVQEGMIAVDKDIIPLGTKVFVEGYGVMLAADTGGAIKGDRIDIFMDNRQEALDFGRQHLTIVYYKAVE